MQAIYIASAINVALIKPISLTIEPIRYIAQTYIKIFSPSSKQNQ